MILIPQTILGECHSVFRRAGPKSTAAKSTTNVHLSGGRDGIRVGLAQHDASIEYHHPTPSESFSFTIPLAVLADFQGRGTSTVQFKPRQNGQTEVTWEQSGIPNRREYPFRETLQNPFPTWPSRDSANDPSLLDALDNAMQIPTGGNAGRLALNCIQLRGQQGDIIATDGRQLLIQGGFQFPWGDSILVPRTPIFASRELPKGEVVRVAQSKTHVHIRIGGWTITLPIETSTRFPNVDAILPKDGHATTRWFVGADEAQALAAILDNLPAAKEEYAPITVDLGRTVAIRARAEEEKRCTEVVLPRSRMEGKAARIVTNRRFLQRALELGFHSLSITAPDKPVLCREDKRIYVWVLLNPTDALAPQQGALRIVLPAGVTRKRTTKATPAPIERSVPIAPIPHPSLRRPMRVFEGFLYGARNLWNLVRKHHHQDRAE